MQPAGITNFAFLLLLALLSLLLMVLKLVLDALYMQFELLLDFNMVANFSLILLELGLVIRRRALSAAIALVATSLLHLSLVLVVLHIHEDLDAGLDVL